MEASHRGGDGRGARANTHRATACVAALDGVSLCALIAPVTYFRDYLIDTPSFAMVA